MTTTDAQVLIDEFASANRAVAWEEAGGDEADEADVAAMKTAEAKLLSALTKKGR